MLSATNTEHAQQAAGERAEAVAGADVVVLAVPYAALDDIARELSDVLTGKVVVEMSNPLSDTCTDLVTAGSSAAEQLQQRLPGASVVKAFNTIFAVRHASPTEGDAPLDAFVAGDDAEAKGKVGELAASLGYRFFDAGALRMARALEEMAFLNITLNATNGWPWQSAWKLVGPTSSS